MKDRVLAAVAAMGALGYLYTDWQIPPTQLGDPLGPRAFPALVGVLLLISAGLLALETRRPKPVDIPLTARASHVPVLLGMAVWTGCYYAVFEPVGYLIATVVYMFALLCYFNKGRHVTNIAVAVGFTGIAYGVFTQLLNVQLPRGPLGI